MSCQEFGWISHKIGLTWDKNSDWVRRSKLEKIHCHGEIPFHCQPCKNIFVFTKVSLIFHLFSLIPGALFIPPFDVVCNFWQEMWFCSQWVNTIYVCIIGFECYFTSVLWWLSFNQLKTQNFKLRLMSSRKKSIFVIVWSSYTPKKYVPEVNVAVEVSV